MEIIKSLYTTFIVEGDFDEIKSNQNLKLVGYSDRKAECIKYHETMKEFIKAATDNIINHKGRFGLELVSEIGLPVYYNDECNIIGYASSSCANYAELFNILSNIIDVYENVGNTYWKIPKYEIIISCTYTGHKYHKSALELSNSCGTCDGANCDKCNKIFEVEDFKNNKILYSGTDEEMANKILYDNLKYDDIIDSILDYYKLSRSWFKSYIEKNIGYAKCDNTSKYLNLLLKYTNCPVVYM